MYFVIRVQYPIGSVVLRALYMRDGAIQVFPSEAAALRYIARFRLTAGRVEVFRPKSRDEMHLQSMC